MTVSKHLSSKSKRTSALVKVGGSVMAIVPPHVLQALDLDAGAEVKIEAGDGRFTVTPIRPRLGLAARLALCDLTAELPDERQAEDAQWFADRPRGREVI